MAEFWRARAGVRFCLTGLVVLGLASCGSPNETGDDAATESASVTAADIPADFTPTDVCPTPTSCTIAGEISMGHGDPVVAILVNPDLDDPITQWSRSLAGMITCVEDGTSIGACVAASNAPDQCKTEFVRLIPENDPWGEAAAFDAVFLTEGSPCRPVEG